MRRTSAKRVVASANLVREFWKGQPMGDGSAVLTRRAMSLAGPTPAPSARLWRSQAAHLHGTQEVGGAEPPSLTNLLDFGFWIERSPIVNRKS